MCWENTCNYPVHKNVSEIVASAINKNEFIVSCRCFNKFGKFIKVQKDGNTLVDVIYKVFYKDCNASYIEQTKKKTKKRINKHARNVRFYKRISLFPNTFWNMTIRWIGIMLKF